MIEFHIKIEEGPDGVLITGSTPGSAATIEEVKIAREFQQAIEDLCDKNGAEFVPWTNKNPKRN